MTASCPVCGRRWGGLAEAHCASGCHEQFATVRAFDRHRPHRGGGCPDPAELRDGSGRPLLQRVMRADGPVWAMWCSDEDRAAVRRRMRPDQEAP